MHVNYLKSDCVKSEEIKYKFNIYKVKKEKDVKVNPRWEKKWNTPKQTHYWPFRNFDCNEVTQCYYKQFLVFTLN